MNEFSAAMGLCNLKHVDEEIEKRKKVVEYYRSLLEDTQGIRLNIYSKRVTPNYAYFPVLFDSKEIRDYIFEKLRSENIYARKYFYPITADQACFKNKFKLVDLAVARSCSERILILPLYADLEINQVKLIVACVKRCLNICMNDR